MDWPVFPRFRFGWLPCGYSTDACTDVGLTYVLLTALNLLITGGDLLRMVWMMWMLTDVARCGFGGLYKMWKGM